MTIIVKKKKHTSFWPINALLGTAIAVSLESEKIQWSYDFDDSKAYTAMINNHLFDVDPVAKKELERFGSIDKLDRRAIDYLVGKTMLESFGVPYTVDRNLNFKTQPMNGEYVAVDFDRTIIDDFRDNAGGLVVCIRPKNTKDNSEIMLSFVSRVENYLSSKIEVIERYLENSDQVDCEPLRERPDASTHRM